MPGACSRDGTDHSVLVDSLGPDLAVAGRFDRGGALRQECHRHSGAALAAAGYFTRKAGQQNQC